MTISGCKIILFDGPSLITILRDDLPDIAFPDHWDLPGGGIDAGETPKQALLREVREELGLDIAGLPIVWQARYSTIAGGASYFYAAPIPRGMIEQIQFGDEGQRWDMMPIATFCTHPRAVPHFKTRVSDFSNSGARTG